MSDNSPVKKIERAIADNARNNEYVNRTGLCVVCRRSPVYDTPGGKSMTCGRDQCRRAFILHELANCPQCGGFAFKRLMMQEDNLGNKKYHCDNCGVIVDRRRVVVDTVIGNEDEQ